MHGNIVNGLFQLSSKLGDKIKNFNLTSPSLIFFIDFRILASFNFYHNFVPFRLFSEEMEFVDNLLEKDVRNNSAWNQRHFVIVHTSGFTPDIIKKELEFTSSKIRDVAHNESAWNYLRG